MTNPIRPKVSKAIKQIASSDQEGKSKAKIDTKNEYDKLKDYLSGNYDELNQAERNCIQHLLDKAKSFINDKLQENIDTNSDKYSSTENPHQPANDDTIEDSISHENSENQTPDTSPDGDMGQVKDSNSHEYSENQTPDTSPDDDMVEDSTSYDKTSENQTPDTSPDDDMVEDSNNDRTSERNNNPPRGTRVIIDGKFCIKMPNGNIYDAMTGRRIQ